MKHAQIGGRMLFTANVARRLRAAIATLGIASSIAACGSGPSGASGTPTTVPPSPTTGTIAPTPTSFTASLPAASPTPAASSIAGWPTPDVVLTFGVESAMKVVVAELNLRSEPSLHGPVVGLVHLNDVILVRSWPVTADGYTWYYGRLAYPKKGALPALPEAGSPPDIDAPRGWIAVGTDATPYMTRLAPRCPTVVDFANVAAMLDSERVACLGDTAIDLEASLWCLDCGGIGYAGTPEWLMNDSRDPVLLVHEGSVPVLSLKFPPSVTCTVEATGKFVRIRGHFDDPQSATCAVLLDDGHDGSIPLDPKVAVAFCRSRFVVETMVILGPDPAWQGV